MKFWWWIFFFFPAHCSFNGKNKESLFFSKKCSLQAFPFYLDFCDLTCSSMRLFTFDLRVTLKFKYLSLLYWIPSCAIHLCLFSVFFTLFSCLFLLLLFFSFFFVQFVHFISVISTNCMLLLLPFKFPIHNYGSCIRNSGKISMCINILLCVCILRIFMWNGWCCPVSWVQNVFGYTNQIAL